MSATIVDRILAERNNFIAKHGEKPKVVLLSRENFMKLRNWEIANPSAEVMQSSSMISGMWIIMDPGSDIRIGSV